MKNTATRIRFESLKQQVERIILPTECSAKFEIDRCPNSELMIFAAEQGLEFEIYSTFNAVEVNIRGMVILLWSNKLG